MDKFARVIGVSSVALAARGATAAELTISPFGAVELSKLDARLGVESKSVKLGAGTAGLSVAISSTLASNE
jgi:hypothetical protein